MSLEIILASSPFKLYVALSRNSGRHSIRLLRDFDGNLKFKLAHDPTLLAEDERLEQLDRETKALYERYYDMCLPVS